MDLLKNRMIQKCNKANSYDIRIILCSLFITVINIVLAIAKYESGIIWNFVTLITMIYVAIKYRNHNVKDYFSSINLILAIIASLSFSYQAYSYLGKWGIFACVALGVPFFIFVFSGVRNVIPKAIQLVLESVELQYNPLKSSLIIFVYVFITLFCYWMTYFPYINSPDPINQWSQIHGVIDYANVHAIGHTVFLKALLSIYDSYAIVVLVHIFMIAFMFALFSHYFSKKQIPFSLQFLLIGLFNANICISKIYLAPLKDTPYLFCVGILIYLLILMNDKRSQEKINYGFYIAFGAVVAGIGLFRLNGIVIILFAIIYLTVTQVRLKQIARLLVAIIAFVAVYGGVNWYAYDVLDTKSPNNGFSIQVFGTGLAAIAHDNPTEEELNAISEVLPIEWIMDEYNPLYISGLIWNFDDSDVIAENPDLEVFNNEFVLAMGENKVEIIKLYFKLLPNHLLACINNVITSTRIIWGQLNPAWYAICFSNVFISIFYILLSLCFGGKKFWKNNWSVFAPVVLNAVSIAISTVTNEYRYLLPTVVMCPVLLMYTLQKYKETLEKE